MASKLLSPADLFSLEQYAKARPEFRQRVIAHKKLRIVAVGPNATWCFEDRILVQYQVQEMLRIEKIFEAAGIQEELDAYNPLLPTGSNWKATMMIEFPDPSVRAVALTQLKGVEDRCWVQVQGCEKVWAIADEDLERENEEKTAAVHFLRFELTPPMKARVAEGADISVGMEHERYNHSLSPLAKDVRQSLAADLV